MPLLVHKQLSAILEKRRRPLAVASLEIFPEFWGCDDLGTWCVCKWLTSSR